VSKRSRALLHSGCLEQMVVVEHAISRLLASQSRSHLSAGMNRIMSLHRYFAHSETPVCDGLLKWHLDIDAYSEGPFACLHTQLQPSRMCKGAESCQRLHNVPASQQPARSKLPAPSTTCLGRARWLSHFGFDSWSAESTRLPATLNPAHGLRILSTEPRLHRLTAHDAASLEGQ
jgi:hypothetical protein